MNSIPKSYIISTLISHVDSDTLRKDFSMKKETDIEERLNSYSRTKLIDYIEKTGGLLKESYENCSELFPLKAAPTLYIINLAKKIDIEKVQELSKLHTERGRESALVDTNSKVIRAVYTRNPFRQVSTAPQVFETIIGYEKRIEINEWNPDEEDYAEKKEVYSLENALIWFPCELANYGIIACNDFNAIVPIITYINTYYHVGAYLPDLTYEMLMKISDGGAIRNATFTNAMNSDGGDIDVQSFTLYDANLSETRIFHNIKKQPGREQRSGFYTNHPDILRAGIGITRKYGRVWTPAHLNRTELIKLAVGIVIRLDKQLQDSAQNNLHDFITYNSNAPVLVGSKFLNGEARKLYDELVYLLVQANRNNNHHIVVSPDTIKGFIKHKNECLPQ